MGKGRTNIDRTQRAVFDLMAAQRMYEDELLEIAIAAPTYEVPETIDVAFLERTLILKGMAAIFEDEALGYITLPIRASERDLYGNPKNPVAYSPVGGYTKELNPDNSVIIYNNRLKRPSMNEIRYYAKKLAQIDQIIATNLNAQRYPILIRCSKDMKLTMLNAYEQYEAGVPVIFGDDKIQSTVANMQVFSTGAPYIADKTYEIKLQIWNEAMTALGVPNNAVMKKERVTTVETERAQGGTDALRRSKYLARETAMEKCRILFPGETWNVYYGLGEASLDGEGTPTNAEDKEKEVKEGEKNG